VLLVLVAASPASAGRKPTPATAPGAPTVAIAASDTLGAAAPATFTKPKGCGRACPVAYTFQLDAGTPVTVKARHGDWSGALTVTHLGPLTLSVYGTAGNGKPGRVTSVSLTGTRPGTPYRDGYFTGGSHPGLLTVGTGANPGLWLSPGTGNGRVGTPIDIGSLGTGVNPGRDGPADWAGAIVLHGDFTGHGVQDVMAYYPSGQDEGDGVIIGGAGDASALVPSPGNEWRVSGLGNAPVRLVAAGYASQQAACLRGARNCLDDLIGIASDGTGDGLYLYASQGTPGVYAPATLSTSAPDPRDRNWAHYTLATAQPGTAPASTAKASTVLFALDTANGTLWESVNPHAGNPKFGPTTLVGTGRWRQIGVPWGSRPPALLQGDINHGGATELWTRSGNTLTSYALSGSALTKESTQPYGRLLSAWPLTDGSPYVQGPGTTTATDAIAGHDAGLSPRGAGWISDGYFGTCAALGQRGYLALPTSTIARSQRAPELSLWFKTTKPDGVLFSLQDAQLKPRGRTPGGYDPVLYIGDNGKLYGQWWNGSKRSPLGTPGPVDDGLWHHVVLAASAHEQRLYLDGREVGTSRGTVDLAGISKRALHPYLGVGYIGGSWPHEPYYKKHHSTGYTEHFTGEIARVTYSSGATP
jgi:Concanavalin A-like lectin/glucanases superfamily